MATSCVAPNRPAAHPWKDPACSIPYGIGALPTEEANDANAAGAASGVPVPHSAHRVGDALRRAGETAADEQLAAAVWGSLGLAALVFAGIAVYGLLVPGGGKPAENVIIVERETEQPSI